MADPSLPVDIVRSPTSSCGHGGTISHRSSFADNMRHSPRSARHPSFSHGVVQELLNHPPITRAGDPRFVGRDWRQIRVGELILPKDLKWTEIDTDIKNATQLLINAGSPNVILLRETPAESKVCGTFDYSDLNAYLLVVVGLASPEQGQLELFDTIVKKTRDSASIPLRDIQTLAKKSPPVTLSESADLSKAIETFGSGVHRILVCRDGTSDIIGVLSQLNLVKFLWDNGSSFPAIDALYPIVLKDLNIGTPNAIAINGDKSLSEALQFMNNEGITSIAVIDNDMNVIGNISVTDAKLLTNRSSLPMLQGNCFHFVSVILSERGIGDGKDSFPVFHVNPYSTLAHTVAKLVATRSHRMWIVEAASPSLSQQSSSHTTLSTSSSSGPTSPTLQGVFPGVSAAALPGSRLSGRLKGVISLSDILNLFARKSGLNPLNLNDQRALRRRSSSSLSRPSIESARGSSIDLRR